MRFIKGILNICIAFLICVIIIANFAVNLFAETILNKQYTFAILEENNYYEKIETDLKNGFENYKYQSGLPDEVFNDLYTTEMVKEDIDSIINNIYDNTEITNNSENIKNNLTQNVNNYLSQNNITLTESEQKNIDDFEDIIINTYEKKINVSDDIIEKINTVRAKCENIINFVRIGLIVALIGILLFGLLVNVSSFSGFLSVISIGLLSSGSILNIITFVVKKNIDISNILILSQSISDFIKEVIYDILGKFNYYGIIFIVVGILGIIISSFCKAKKIEKDKA